MKIIFSPEHGLFGEAADGEKVNYNGQLNTLPPDASLYGSNRKPKKEHCVTVRVGDGTPLYPLQKNYLASKPLLFSDLKKMDNASFLKSQLDVEKNVANPSERIGILLTYGALAFACIFTVLL